MSNNALNILISADALPYVRERLAAEPVKTNLRFIPYRGQPLDMLDLQDIDIAFVSRDITGRSTKYVLEPHTELFYQTLETAPNLQWVQVHSAGVDRPVYINLHAKGVKVTSSAGALAGIVAQSVLGAVLALNRRFRYLEASQREHRWTPLLGDLMPPDLAGQRALIAGWGPIGQTVQRYLAMLGMHVSVLRNRGLNKTDDVDQAIPMIAYADMASELSRVDWLILACPLTDTTRGLVSGQALAGMKPAACIVNVSRGEVIDEAALIAALKQGKLGGAYLDVVDKEPLDAGSELWDMPNVIVSPHTAGHSLGNERRVADIFVENLANWVAGRPLRNLVK